MNIPKSIKTDLGTMIQDLKWINQEIDIGNYHNIKDIDDVISDLQKLQKNINNNFETHLNEIYNKTCAKLQKIVPDISTFNEKEKLVKKVTKVVSYLYKLKLDT